MKSIKNVCLILAMSFIYLLSGCGKSDVTGEVFVVTQGRSNIALGGARIYFIKDVDAKIFYGKEKRSRDIEVEQTKSELDGALSKVTDAFAESTLRKTSYLARIGVLIDQIYDVALKDHEFIARDSISQVNQFSSAKIYVFSEIRLRPTVKTRPLIEEVLDLERNIRQESERFGKGRDDYEKIKLEYNQVIKPFGFSDLIAIAEQFSGKKNSSLVVHSINTNALGKFNISLPSGKYRVLSFQERSLPSGGMEQYAWAVLIDLDVSKNIVLSNSNMSPTPDHALSAVIK